MAPPRPRPRSRRSPASSPRTAERPGLGDRTRSPRTTRGRGLPRARLPACSPCRCRSCRGTTCSSSARSSSTRWTGPATRRSPTTTGPLGDRLTPRKSFAIWKETVDRQAQPWTEADREIAEATRAATVEVVLRHNEMMAEERAKADVRQRMLNEELNHRVKNILAVIRSLVGQPVAEGRSLATMSTSLRGRIQALAYAHDQVARGDGGGLLADLLGAELAPYRTPARGVAARRPAVWLDARAFSVMALVLHELATNAAKYGALSRTGGQLVRTLALRCGGRLRDRLA